jgi:hypothetical protein
MPLSRMKTKQMLTKTVKGEMATTKPAKKSRTMKPAKRSMMMSYGAAGKSRGKKGSSTICRPWRET